MKKLLFLIIALIIPLTLSAQLADSPVLKISDFPTLNLMSKRSDSSSALIVKGESSRNKSPKRKANLAEGQCIIGNYTTDSVATGEVNGMGIQGYEGVISLATTINTAAVKGNTISSIRIGLAVPAKLTRVFIYPIEDADNIIPIGDGYYEESLTLDAQLGWNVIELNELYTIVSDQIYIGYEYQQTADSYPVSFVPLGETVESYMYLDVGEGLKWYQLGAVDNGYGNLCIQTIVNGSETSSIPSKLTASHITVESAMLSWWGGSAPFELRYRTAAVDSENIEAGEWQTFNTDGNSWTLKNLSRGTQYDWQVRTSGDEWSEIASFSALIGPRAPKVTIDGISFTTATVKWSASEGLSYNLRYAEQTSDGEPNWTVVENVTSPYTFENLTLETTYIVQLQSVDEISAGAWDGSKFTTTLLTVPPTQLTATPIHVSALVAWEGILTNYEVQYRLSSDSEWKSATADGKTCVLKGLYANSSYEWRVRGLIKDGRKSEWATSTFTTLNSDDYVPQAIWCQNNKTLYFTYSGNYTAGQQYDNQTITRVWSDTGITTGVITATGYKEPGWYDVRNDATTVVFDWSFASVKPTSTWDWFLNFKNLTTITGLEYLNTSETESMYCMFTSCEKMTSFDISTFDMSSVIGMSGMFGYCYNLETVNFGSLDMSRVGSVFAMFAECPKLTTIYCDNAWNFTDENSKDMFDGCTSLVGASGTTYDSNNITATYANPTTGYFTWTKSNVLCCDDNTTFCLAATDSYKVGDQIGDMTVSSVWSLCDAAGTATPMWQDALKSTVTKAVIDESFADERPKYAVAWFENFENLTEITGLSNFNTSEVTDMRYLFSNCVNLTSLNLSTFNTAKVTNMSKMFRHCEKLSSLDIKTWDTSNLKDMNYMFQSCQVLPTPDLSIFNTAAVTNMSGAFVDCQAFEALDLSSFNTSNVTTMNRMFDGCDALTTINLRSFDVSKVTNMYQMFRNCGALTTIISDATWSCSGSSTEMFVGCTSLVGSNGTTCDGINNIDVSYARPDLADTPGYFKHWLKGDINGDGQVTIADVTAAVNIILGKATGNYFYAAVDVNGDSQATIADVTYLVNIVLGKENKQELLTNGVGDGTFDGWTIDQEEGDGWAIAIDEETGEGFWKTSYKVCSMSQTVTLANFGFTNEDIDGGKVTCEASADMSFASHNGNTGAKRAEVFVTMYDASGNVLKTMTVVNDCTYYEGWKTFTVREVMPTGTRKLTYTVRGSDIVGWAGHYGPSFRHLSMKGVTPL